MSEQELAQCEAMLKGLLLPDNTKRNEAQSQLQKCLSTIQNKETLSLYCSILLLKSTDLNVQIYCAIILRKIFLTTEKEISNEAVKNFSEQNKSEIKKNLLLSFQSTQNKSLQKNSRCIHQSLRRAHRKRRKMGRFFKIYNKFIQFRIN